LNESKYLIDNNALVDLGAARIRSQFFAEHCVVTNDVLFEAREHPARDALLEASEQTSPALLEQVRAVMKTVRVGETDLIDLYHNKGAADPGLIATVLEARAVDDGAFFADVWTIVSRDGAVVSKAGEFDIPTKTPMDLAIMIDAAT
jgi:hypothetical protein